MRNRFLLLIVILIINLSNLFGQQRIGSFKNDLKENVSSERETISIVNSKNNDVAIFITDAKNVYGYKLDKKLEVVSKLISEEKRRKYNILLGYAITDTNSYKLVLANKYKRKFIIIDFSFLDKKTKVKEFALDDLKEKVVQSISIGNEFYLITTKTFEYVNSAGNRIPESKIDFNKDIVYFNKLEADNSFTKKEVNLSNYTFLDKLNRRIMGRSLIYAKYSNNDIPKIDESVNTPIDITAELTKMYVYENKILFSFDENRNKTQVLEINLPDLSHSFTSFKKTFTKSKKSNSFIYQGNVFIASTTRKELHLELVDFKTKEVIKKFDIYENQDIDFKNGPITQKGGVYTSGKELKTAKQFLRKATADKFGLTVLKNNDIYELSIGGNSPLPRPAGFGGMGGFGGIPIGGFGGVSVFFNPAMFAYGSAGGTKSVQIDCLLDIDFNPKKGDIPETTFDKIKIFKKRMKSSFSSATGSSKNAPVHKKNITKEKVVYEDDKNDIIEIFKRGKEIILGSYDKTSKTYHFYTF